MVYGAAARKFDLQLLGEKTETSHINYRRLRVLEIIFDCGKTETMKFPSLMSLILKVQELRGTKGIKLLKMKFLDEEHVIGGVHAGKE